MKTLDKKLQKIVDKYKKNLKDFIEKNVKNTVDRLELNKYCPRCQKHTKHKEKK